VTAQPVLSLAEGGGRSPPSALRRNEPSESGGQAREAGAAARTSWMPAWPTE